MLNKLYLLLILIAINNISFGQSLFTKIYSSNGDIAGIRVTENSLGDYIIGGFRSNANTNNKEAYIFKVNSKGILKDSLTFNIIGNNINIYEFIEETPNQYIFIGSISSFNNVAGTADNKSIIYIKTDSNLIITDTAYVGIVNNPHLYDMHSKLDIDSNIIIISTSIFNSKFVSYINKLSINGDSLLSSYIPADSNRSFMNLIINDSSYLVYTNIFSGLVSQLIYEYDLTFNIINTHIINNYCSVLYAPIKVNDSTYYNCGSKHDLSYRRMAAVKSTLDGQLIDSVAVGVIDSNNYVAFYNGLCKTSENLYLFGAPYSSNSINISYGNGKPSYLYLVKLDEHLNIIWEKLYGGDAFYTPYNVISTSDGGVLMHATRVSLNNNSNNVRSICLIKVDSNGNTTWVQNIKQSAVELLLYPNPTSSQLNITLKSPNKSIRQLQITDLQGKQILQKQVNTKQTKLDVSSLSTGVYILEGLTNTGESFSGKFVKE